MTLKQRLDIYNQALRDYQNKVNKTCNGFCFYFNEKYGTTRINYYDSLKQRLPELYATFDTFDGTICANRVYGATPRRIQCLKIAIKSTKDKIKRSKNK